jgi:hypothetical protein
MHARGSNSPQNVYIGKLIEFLQFAPQWLQTRKLTWIPAPPVQKWTPYSKCGQHPTHGTAQPEDYILAGQLLE